MTLPAQASALPYLGVLLNAAVWGMSWWPFKRLDSQGLHPLWATAIIYTVTALVILVVRRKELIAERGWKLVLTNPWLLLLGLASGLNNAGFNWAVTIGDVVRVVLLFYLMPMWSALLARWILNEPLTAIHGVQIVMALIGASLVMQTPGSAWSFPMPQSQADGLAVFGGFFFALTTVMLRKNANQPAWASSISMFGIAGIVASIAALLIAPLPTIIGVIPNWLPLLIVFGIAMSCSNLTMQYGAARLAPTITSLLLLNEVLFATVSSVAMGQASLNVSKLLGLALVVGAALLAILWPAPKIKT